MQRLYSQLLVILSICFVMGGMTISNLSVKKKNLLKKPFLRKKSFTRRNRYLGNNEKNNSQVPTYLIILLVLIPYFFCVTGVTYQMFGYSRQITLNSEGRQYDGLYVHDQESYGAKWLGDYAAEHQKIYADFYGERRLLSQGKITPSLINQYWFSNPERIDSYIYLRHQNVVKGELIGRRKETYNMTDYSDIFFEKNEIYDSGCSKIYY